MTTPTEWYKDNFFISTAKSLIDPTAVNAAFATEAIYWAKPMEERLLKRMLDNSLCFGVYELPASSLASKSRCVYQCEALCISDTSKAIREANADSYIYSCRYEPTP